MIASAKPIINRCSTCLNIQHVLKATGYPCCIWIITQCSLLSDLHCVVEIFVYNGGVLFERKYRILLVGYSLPELAWFDLSIIGP